MVQGRWNERDPYARQDEQDLYRDGRPAGRERYRDREERAFGARGDEGYDDARGYDFGPVEDAGYAERGRAYEDVRYGGGSSRYGGSRYGQPDMGRHDFGGHRPDAYGLGSDNRGGGRRDYGRDHRQGRTGYGVTWNGESGRQAADMRDERSWWDRTRDEVSSWVGDEDAERRRRQDEVRAEHRGRGPKNYTRSDDRIREDVNDRLTDDPFLDASEIDVQVKACEVTLSGTVDSREDKRRAEDCAERVSAVKHVQNNLRVQQAGASNGDGSAQMARTGSQAAAKGADA